MASSYFGLNLGQTENTGLAAGTQGVTESASSSGSTDVEIRIDTSKITDKNQAILLIHQLSDWILKNKSSYLGD